MSTVTAIVQDVNRVPLGIQTVEIPTHKCKIHVAMRVPIRSAVLYVGPDGPEIFVELVIDTEEE